MKKKDVVQWGYDGSVDEPDLPDKPIKISLCKRCKGAGWYHVDEWFMGIQGRKDCNHRSLNLTTRTAEEIEESRRSAYPYEY